MKSDELFQGESIDSIGHSPAGYSPRAYFLLQVGLLRVSAACYKIG